MAVRLGHPQNSVYAMDRFYCDSLVLTKLLACIPSFRDAVLQQKPMLLDTLLARAIESDSAFDKVIV